MMLRAHTLFLIVGTVTALGCSGGGDGDTSRRDSQALSLVTPAVDVVPPAQPGSAQPNLYAAHDGMLYLSWVETMGPANALRFARRTAAGWSAPGVVAMGTDWFINWADFPSIIATPSGLLIAHWLQKSGEGTYDYDVKISMSLDDGETWQGAVRPYLEQTSGEHGFVSMLPWHPVAVLAVWLDGRNVAPSGHDSAGAEAGATMLMMAVINEERQLVEDAVLDERVCDCCQTSAALTSNGAVVVYRDRSEDEIRDISIVRVFADGRRPSKPLTIANDGWQIEGCPVNGPSVAASGERIAVAWFTAANDTPRVQIAFSTDEGQSFQQPVRIDGSNPMGRVDIATLGDGSVVVSWMEFAGEGADIRLRRVWPDGRMGEMIAIARSSSERASGFPVIASNEKEILVAWTDVASGVRAVSLPIR